jgi:hypothetical protein
VSRAKARLVAVDGGRRTVHCRIEVGGFAGWEWTAHADFKAKVYAELQSGSIERIIAVLDEKVIIEHNFPDFEDPDLTAASLGDVDVGALNVIVDRTFDAIGKLPSR